MPDAPAIARPVILVIAPMPAMPTSAGNRRRLLSTCDFLKSAGFDVDFAYVAHEDQIYRRYNQHPPTDIAAMSGFFRRLYLIEIAAPIRLKTGANGFDIDDWCPPEVDAFVRSYFATATETSAILVNYVWLSRALEAVPDGVLKLIDTHDRFAHRKAQYQPFRAEANFFHTDLEGEARGLARADIAIAIQPVEQAYFARLTGRPEALLLPKFDEIRPFLTPKGLATIGFIGHGNDANLLSIGRFAGLWGARWQTGWPRLLIAGEICRSLPADMGPGIELLGYVERIEDFFDRIDLSVAPILFGTGLKMKVVETLAHGVAVVGTPLAFEGIETDLPAHRLHDLNAMIDQILALSGDLEALATLYAACAEVFDTYRSTAAEAEGRLAEDIRRRCAATPARSGSSASQDTHGDGRNGDPGLELLRRPSSNDASLVATEFVPFVARSPETALPMRRQWFLPHQDAVKTAPARGPAGAVSLSPLLTKVPTDPTDREASCQALETLLLAAPDWHTTAERLTLSDDAVRIIFAGPAFVLKPTVPIRVFAFDADGRIDEIADPRPMPLPRLPQTIAQPAPLLTERCGDGPVAALALTGTWRGTRRQAPIAGVFVIAHALLGRIDVFDAATGGGAVKP